MRSHGDSRDPIPGTLTPRCPKNDIEARSRGPLGPEVAGTKCKSEQAKKAAPGRIAEVDDVRPTMVGQEGGGDDGWNRLALPLAE